MTRRNERRRHVWASELPGGPATDVVPIKPNAQLAKPLDDHPDACFAKRGQFDEGFGKRVWGGAAEVPEQVHGSLGDLDRQLDTGDDADLATGRGRDSLVQPADGVVVGHSKNVNVFEGGVRDQSCRVQVTVRRGRVGMQIDQDAYSRHMAEDRHTPVGYVSPMTPNTSDRAIRVYSSDSGRIKSDPPRVARQPAAHSPPPPKDGIVRVSRTKTGRGGKTVTLVTGLPIAVLDATAKELKRLCGTGGTAKDGIVEIQGDHRERVVAHLSQRYQTKLAGG